MAERVAICAVAQTPYEPNMWHKRFQEMAFDVVEPVVKQTGVTFDPDKGIDTVITCSDDVFDARTISDNGLTDAVGAHFRCEEKIAMDGINTIGYARACILSGHTDIVLIVGHCKESQPESRDMCTNLAFDPFYLRPLGMDFKNMAALQAREYMKKSGVTDEHLAKVVVRSRRNACRNPFANAKVTIWEEDVLKSPMVCDPIRELHVYPVSDGAIGMLVTAEDRALEFTDNPVWVSGFANCMDSYFPGDRDLTSNFALKNAAERCYKQAGVKDPASEFDVVEVNDCYAYQLPMWIEGLGVCAENKGGEWIDANGMVKNNVNLSGGMLAGNPIMLGGLARAAEAVLQLRGEAGARQVEKPKRALAHGTTGGAGQFHSVLVLDKE